MKWVLSFCCCVIAAGGADSNNAPVPAKRGVLLAGRIEHPRLTESSGIVASRKDTNVFWTHNDGGGKRQVLYAMTRQGRSLAEFRVTGATLEDWEDIAADDKGRLFLGDVGNNDLKRTVIAVHQLQEPDARAAQTGLASITRTWNLRYPASSFDCESLFVWGNHGYLISKVINDERADIYRFSLTNDAPFQTLEEVGELRIDSPVTGADISPDGTLLGIVAKNGAYVYGIRGEVAAATRAKPHQNKFKHDQIEACTFVPEGLLTTAESREIYLFTEQAFRSGPKTKK